MHGSDHENPKVCQHTVVCRGARCRCSCSTHCCTWAAVNAAGKCTQAVTQVVYVTMQLQEEDRKLMWLCAGAVAVVVDGIPSIVIEAENLLGQHCFDSSRRSAVVRCQEACEYLDIEAEGLDNESKQMQALQEEEQLCIPIVSNPQIAVFSSDVFRVKKLLRNGVAVASFKQTPLNQDKRVLDGADPVWVANLASLSRDGVLTLQDVDDSSDAVTVSVPQALVMTGSASHPLLARRASFCLAASSSIAYFISCSDEEQRSEFLQALAAVGAIIENPSMLTGGSRQDFLAQAALHQPESHVSSLRNTGKASSSSVNERASDDRSVHQHAALDSPIPPAPPLSRKKSADPPPAPKSPSVGTPTPAPVLAPAQPPPILPQRSSPPSHSLPPLSPITSHSSSYETFALQVSDSLSPRILTHNQPRYLFLTLSSAVHYLLYSPKRLPALCRPRRRALVSSFQPPRRLF